MSVENDKALNVVHGDVLESFPRFSDLFVDNLRLAAVADQCRETFEGGVPEAKKVLVQDWFEVFQNLDKAVAHVGAVARAELGQKLPDLDHQSFQFLDFDA